MSKRRSRGSAPNIPQATLERARRQAAIERGELPPDPEPAVETPAAPPVGPDPASADAAPVRPTPAPRPTDARAAVQPVARASTHSVVATSGVRTVTAAERRAKEAVRSRKPRTREERDARDGLDAETIAELLANPTRIVTEAELRRDYSYVLGDVRSMGALAGALVVLLIVLAQVLPR